MFSSLQVVVGVAVTKVAEVVLAVIAPLTSLALQQQLCTP
jgi:hypothetical protein